jgi:Na+:H+ antiporter, NhaA family
MELPPLTTPRLAAPVTGRMHQGFTRLRAGQTVGEALDWLRRNPPPGRVIYFYVVDGEGRLLGVVPTRRLVLSPAQAALTDIMVKKLVTVPAAATVLDACEFFIQHRLLAFPVVDEQKHILGVVDIDLYTDELSQLERATPLGRLVAPLTRFFRIEASGGLVLLAFTAVALVLANSPLSTAYASFWQAPVGVRLGDFALEMPLLLWVNDGLMTLFFFVVGLEIKRELIAGELADPRKALLPVVAALGGMVVPAAVYSLCAWGGPGRHGWGVPMATDIAFVVGVLTLLGPRVPSGLKVLLLTLAIADDIGAVLVIAVAYSTGIAFWALVAAGGGLGLIVLLGWLGARGIAVSAILGVGLWLAFLHSGVHPTVAGALLGLLTPARPGLGRRVLLDVVSDLYARLRGQRGAPQAAPQAVSPLDQLEAALHPWVAFVIMPVFALANAGVTVEVTALATPVALAAALGLILGKPAGIVLFSWASMRLGLTRLPDGVNWRAMLGAGCLGGIGFTMSLFIAGLAFDGVLRDQAKIGILAGSALSAAIGSSLLLCFLGKQPEAASSGRRPRGADRREREAV